MSTVHSVAAVSRSESATFSRKARALPVKPDGWEPLHLTFRPGSLPKLPVIHSADILSVLKSKLYIEAVKPSNHSIKTLAWMGDAVLQLAATKATLLLAGFEEKTNKHLAAIRSGLTCNRTFAYLTASYRIVDQIAPAHISCIQKRHADFFEAYIGAAWISASQTKDPEHIREIEYYLSQLYKPRVWPALESLVNGHGGMFSAVKLDQPLDGSSDSIISGLGSRDDGSGEVTVIDVPVLQTRSKKRPPLLARRIHTAVNGRGGKRTGSSHADRLHVVASYRYHEKRHDIPPRVTAMRRQMIEQSNEGESEKSPIVVE